MPGEGMVTLKLRPGDQEKLNMALKVLGQKVDLNTPIVLAQAGHRGADYCKTNCPVGISGELRASIGNPKEGGIFQILPIGAGIGVMFGTAMNYAVHVEEGTRPHIIKPVKAKVLAWPVGPVGQKIKISTEGIKRGGLLYRTSGGKLTGKSQEGEYRFAKVVHHPGFQGRHYMLKGVQQAVPEMVKILSGVIR